MSMVPDDFELAQMQAVALFVHDERGRLLRINESDPTEPAPRFFLSRTASGNLWRTRYDLPADLAGALEQLAAGEPVVGDLSQRPRYEGEYIALLEQHAPLSSTYAGPAYYLPELSPPNGAQNVTITPANTALLEPHYPYAQSEYADLAPVIVHVEDGIAVSICFSARITGQVAEVGVHTAEHYRGRGYAAETVCAWVSAIRAMGRLPLYSTEWENAASLAVARKLGAVQYALELSLT
jgi:RimJ/RimL family protein N-acetyltransferase